jgi:maleate cis-trans isomerase
MYGKVGRIGLAVLDIDLCIEPDLRRVLPEGVEIHTARVIYPHEVTVEAMAEARRGLDLAVRSLAAVQPRAIVWSCTSGSFYNGVAGNEDLLAQLARASPEIPIATASSALVAALRALHIQRPAVGTPYSPEINQLLCNFLQESGFRPFPVAGYFDRLVDDITLQSVEPEEVAAFARAIDRPDADAVVISCTGLPTSKVVPMLEKELGKPVISSNLAILWHALEIGGIAVRPHHAGRLFALEARNVR